MWLAGGRARVRGDRAPGMACDPDPTRGRRLAGHGPRRGRPRTRARTLARRGGVADRERCRTGRCRRPRMAVYEHPPARAVRLHGGVPPARARSVSTPPHDLRRLVPACGSRHRPVPARTATVASRAGHGPNSYAGRAREHERSAVPQRDRRRGQPALRLRRLRRSGVHLALSAIASRLADARVSGPRVRRRRRNRQSLHRRLCHRLAHVRARRKCGVASPPGARARAGARCRRATPSASRSGTA